MISELPKNNNSTLNNESEVHLLFINFVNKACSYYKRKSHFLDACSSSDSKGAIKRAISNILPLLLILLTVNVAALLAPSIVYGEELVATTVNEKGQPKEPAEKNSDPLESINRVSFWVTDTTDIYLLKPVAKAYEFILPDFASQAISNIFMNISDIQVMLNNLFQLKLKNSAIDAGRFSVNTTVGILGIFDVATKWGLEKHYEDFGQTLGYWGIPAGPYLFIPFLGPSSFRDTAGLVGDYYMTPRNYFDSTRTRNQLFLLETVDRRGRSLRVEGVVYGDRYTFIRDFYINRREYLVNDGIVEEGSFEEDSFEEGIFDDFDDAEFDDMDDFDGE